MELETTSEPFFESERLPDFSLLQIDEHDGWGPSDIPSEFKDMPYQPFAKDTRLGRVADWSGSVYQDMKSKGRYASHFIGAQYAYFHDEDDSNFQMVTSGKDQRSSGLRQRFRFPMRGRRGGPFPYFGGRGGHMQYQSGPGGYGGRKSRNMSDRDRMMQQQQNRRWHHWGTGPGGGQRRGGNMGQGNWRGGGGSWGGADRRQGNRAARDASVQIKDTWVLQEEMDFARFSKLALPSVKDPEDVVQCGEMEYYDKSYDRVTTRNERPLIRVNRVIHTVTTTGDPVIRRLAKASVGNVYCTDAIAAAIMCCTRSVNSWDLVVSHIDDRLFFDKRRKSTFDFVTVCETAADPPMEEAGHMNSAQCLALEATYINTNLSQQMLLMGGKKYAFPEKNPFIEEDEEDEDEEDDDEEEGEEVGNEQDAGRAGGRGKGERKEFASVGYRYRLFDLGNGINLVVRCEVNGVLPSAMNVASDTGDSTAPPQFISIRALNEFDSRYCVGVDWRSKLDTQRGAVIASEIKNNAFKLAKWTVCSLLAGADQLKFGFVSRVNPKDSSKHVILGTQQFKPQEFALQLNMNMDNAWGILRCVIDFFMKTPNGKYLMLKDPNKPLLRIYAIPLDAFDSDESDDESSDEEDTAGAEPVQPEEHQEASDERPSNDLDIDGEKKGSEDSEDAKQTPAADEAKSSSPTTNIEQSNDSGED